jgi:Immunity protein 42
MYTFGDVATFAVSYELNQDYGGSWLFGKFCYWIGGELVGDYELGTSLRDVLTVLGAVVRDNGNRENINLFKLSSEELYRRLDCALYGGWDGDSEYEKLAQEECWARFQIHLQVDIFDHWKVYLIDSPPEARVVYSFAEGSVVDINLISGTFDQVITNAFNTLFDIYEVEIVKESTQ